MSSPTTSTSSRSPVVVAIAFGSNLGDRRYYLRRAIHELRDFVRFVRFSSVRETEPVDSPRGAGRFLNMVGVGYTALPADSLMATLRETEARLGRRRSVRNAPRTIDLDLIIYGATLLRTKALTLPHPRARERAFVMEPLQEVAAALARRL
jgi:2-amino-4-hydroxy-6-hydroxymethyldihydropteridine diphosphokinase